MSLFALTYKTNIHLMFCGLIRSFYLAHNIEFLCLALIALTNVLDFAQKDYVMANNLDDQQIERTSRDDDNGGIFFSDERPLM